MKTKKLLFLIVVLTLTITAVHGQTIRYVKAGATGNGSSWENASGDLQYMINQSGYGDEVWVAAGTYTPTRRADATSSITRNNRNNAFVLKDGVKIYGGFPATGTPGMADRKVNLYNYTSTLSGNIGNSGSSDNAYHVVISVNVDATNKGNTVLDGFTITGGNADGTGSIMVKNYSILNNNGGGMYNVKSSATIHNCSFWDNSSNYDGGSMYNSESSPIISKTSITGLASRNGGGMYNASNSSPDISNCLFSDCGATNGGAIYNENSAGSIINTVIHDNLATSKGGGIFNDGTKINNHNPYIINTTIALNNANEGGAMYNKNTSYPYLTNCIVIGNTSGIHNEAGSVPSIIYSIVEGYPSFVNGNIDPTGITASDIFVAPLSAFRDFSLKKGSIVINKGRNEAYFNKSYPNKDVLGGKRCFEGIIDLGACEYQPDEITPTSNVLYVNKAVGISGNGSSWNSPLKELGDALIWAKENEDKWTQANPLEIWVAAETYYPLYSPANDKFGRPDRRNNSFLIVNNVKLYGGFKGSEQQLSLRNWITNKTILSGNIGNELDEADNVYQVVLSTNSIVGVNISRATTLDGFQITSGNANSNDIINVGPNFFSRNSGGGMHLRYSSMSINNTTFSNNRASLNGGGLYSSLFGTPTLTDALFRGNSAQNGGGIYNYDYCILAIRNSDFISNSATSKGGAINSDYKSAIIINRSTFKMNASQNGAAISNTTAELIMYNSLISGNKATENGGGMSNDNSKSKIVNSTIADNQATSGGGMSNTNLSDITILNSIIVGNNTGVNQVGGSIGISTSLVQSDTEPIDPNEVFTNPATPGLHMLGNYSLKKGSIALNKGTVKDYDLNAFGIEDIAGNPRIVKNVIDMGAFEQPLQLTDNKIFVKKNATGFGDGSSWENAVNELSDAILWARQTRTQRTEQNPLEIWVASGTYKPLYFPESTRIGVDSLRKNSFHIVDKVKIYGGFDGTETQLEQRNWRTNETILSGDIGTEGIDTDNVYHVVTAIGSDGEPVGFNTLLDGFTITGGNANNVGNLSQVNNHNLNNGHGGGIYAYNSSASFKNMNISGNNGMWGGGVIITGKSLGLYSHNVIKGNTAGYGAGIYIADSSPDIANTLIAGNRADNYGGGLYFEASSKPLIGNATITGNQAGIGSGMYILQSSVPILYNSIVLGNKHTGISNISGGVDVKNSLIQDWTGTDNGNLDATGVTVNDVFAAPVEPGLNNGGDYSLKNNSIVIDKGDRILYLNPYFGVVDLVGNPRIAGSDIDLGAYESLGITVENKVVFVNSNASGTGDGSSWTNASTQLAEVLKWAKQNENQWTAENPLQIWVTAGLHNPASSPADGSNGIDEGKYNTFLLPRNVQLYGGFSGSETQPNERNWLVNKTILSGDIGVPGDNSDNVYNVVMSVGTPTNPITPATVLDGFIITGGNANNSGSTIINEQTVYRNTGAGMPNLHSSPTIRNTVFIDNAASGTGGGVYNFSSSPVMSNVLICENTAYNGAGMTNRVSSSPTLTNITISGNTAYNQGGGMENYNSSNPKIRNSIIFGNSSGISSVSGSVPAIQYSLVQELSDASNGNLDATNVTVDDVFSFTSASPSPSSPSRVKSAANDYTLSSGSIAIDRGNNADYNTASLGDKDLAGNTRIIGDFIDLGAFEYQISTDISSPIEDGSIIKVYPNPVTDGMLYITIDKDTEATLYDGGGNAVKKISLISGTNNMNIRDVPAGLYLLRTETGKGIKVIIK